MSRYADMHGGQELYTPGDQLQQGHENAEVVYDTMRTYARIQRAPVVGAVEGGLVGLLVSKLISRARANKAVAKSAAPAVTYANGQIPGSIADVLVGSTAANGTTCTSIQVDESSIKVGGTQVWADVIQVFSDGYTGLYHFHANGDNWDITNLLRGPHPRPFDPHTLDRGFWHTPACDRVRL